MKILGEHPGRKTFEGSYDIRVVLVNAAHTDGGVDRLSSYIMSSA